MSHRILDIFENIATQNADKKAVSYMDTAYTFGELRKMARALAWEIRQHISADEPVGVVVHRGADTALVFLSVIYSGGYYVPIDPELPEAKREAILSDAGIRFVLGTAEHAALFDVVEQAPAYFKVDDWMAEGIFQPQIELLPETTDDSPLYMVYTSGSTGKPKGVLKSHGGMVSFVDAFFETFDFSKEDVIGNQTPFFFDASAKDYYLMLLKGLTLEVIPSELFMFPIKLVELLNERQITYICWVPTALSLVAQLGTFDKILPNTLTKVFFVGEVFPIKQLKKWIQTLPEITYVNLFGSSEIAGICLYYRIDTGAGGTALDNISTLPMGKALPNCEVFLKGTEGDIIDPSMVDVMGEVCVASPALALCYFGDEEKTHAVFYEEALPTKEVKRVLHTGDLARYDEHQDLLFVSRKDFQIKHMGRRIELGEIESVVDKLPEVVRCCCLYNEAKKRIHLFVQLLPECDWDGKMVQTALVGKLSDYMLPNRVTILEEMPFNANGKINRSQLKEML